MSTPRELLRVANDLAQKVAEKQLDHTEAAASLSATAKKYPEHLGTLTDNWADVLLDRLEKRYVDRRNKADSSAIARKLAEHGAEQPDLEGNVDYDDFKKVGPADSTTLAADWEHLSPYVDSSLRLVKSVWIREERHEMLRQAAGGDLSVTRGRAMEALNRMSESDRDQLRAAVRAKLSARRSAMLAKLNRRDDYGLAAEG